MSIVWKDQDGDAEKQVQDTRHTRHLDGSTFELSKTLCFLQVEKTQAKYEYCKKLVQTPDENKPYAFLNLANIGED